MGLQYVNWFEIFLLQVDSGQQVVVIEDYYIFEDIIMVCWDSSICGWVNVIYGCNECCIYCVVFFV